MSSDHTDAESEVSGNQANIPARIRRELGIDDGDTPLVTARSVEPASELSLTLFKPRFITQISSQISSFLPLSPHSP